MKNGLAAILTREEAVEGNRATVKERLLGPLQARDVAQRRSAASPPKGNTDILLIIVGWKCPLRNIDL